MLFWGQQKEGKHCGVPEVLASDYNWMVTVTGDLTKIEVLQWLSLACQSRNLEQMKLQYSSFPWICLFISH